MDDHEKISNYKQIHIFCTKYPKSKQENAIGSSSFSTREKFRSSVKSTVAGDSTNWDGAIVFDVCMH